MSKDQRRDYPAHAYGNKKHEMPRKYKMPRSHGIPFPDNCDNYDTLDPSQKADAILDAIDKVLGPTPEARANRSKENLEDFESAGMDIHRELIQLSKDCDALPPDPLLNAKLHAAASRLKKEVFGFE